MCVCTWGDDHSVHDDSRSVDTNLDVFVLQETAQDRKYRPLTYLLLPVHTHTEVDRKGTLGDNRKHNNDISSVKRHKQPGTATDQSTIMAAAASLRTDVLLCISLCLSSETPSEARAGPGSSLEQEVRVERSSTWTTSSSSSWSFSISLGTSSRSS